MRYKIGVALVVKIVRHLPFLNSLTESDGFSNHVYLFLGFSVEDEQDCMAVVLPPLLFYLSV